MLPVMTKMPEKNQVNLKNIADNQDRINKTAQSLNSKVIHLSDTIGLRNYVYKDGLEKSVKWIEAQFLSLKYHPKCLPYPISNNSNKNKNLLFYNIEAELKGTESPNKILIIGAHYDSVAVDGSAGADDNASGVAGIIELASYYADKPQKNTIRFVAFVNEEPPFFWTKNMGSYVYAKNCKDKRENIIGMISLECIGYFSNRQNSQKYPFPIYLLYPSTGNFIGFVSNINSRKFLKKTIGFFRKSSLIGSEGGAFPGFVQGVGWSDQSSFWDMGFDALMITDTALFRNPYYHTSYDTYDKLDYISMAKVIVGLEEVIKYL